jgi:hypothetical protein
MSLSDNGCAILPFGNSTTDMNIYYTNNYGSSWHESTINWQQTNLGNPQNIRGGYITRNGIYAIFVVPHTNGNETIYWSQDGGANFSQLYYGTHHYWYVSTGGYIISEDGNHILGLQDIGNYNQNNGNGVKTQGPLVYRDRSTNNWIMTNDRSPSPNVNIGCKHFKANGDFTKAFMLIHYNTSVNTSHILKKYDGTAANIALYADGTSNGWSNVDTSIIDEYEPLDMSMDGNTFLYANGTQLNISRDGGDTFENLASNTSSGVFSGVSGWDCLSMSSDSSVIVAVANNTNSPIYLSTDVGYTWIVFILVIT